MVFEYLPWLRALLVGDATATLNGTEGDNGVYVALIDTGVYTPDPAHEFYSQIPSGAIIGTPQEILNKSVLTNGKFTGSGVSFVNVTGASIEAVAFYRKNAGADTTWRLVFYDTEIINVTTGLAGFPLNPNTGNLNLTWNVGGIF